MNLFNKAIYKNSLEHTAPGTHWGKHKYLYITETGRYVYPEDLRNGQTAEQYRSRQINDQIKSAHSNATSSKMELTPGSELKKRAEARAAAKTSGTAAGSKSLSSNTSRNSVNIKSDTTAKTEEKKTDTTTNDGSRYKNMSEETKQWLMKNAGKDEKKEKEKKGSGKKGGSGKKKGSSGKSSSKSTKTEEQKQMGLTDDDLDKMEINTQATNRDEVLKNIALRVIRGDYGNEADRKAKLGSYYDEVQKRVNEIAREGNVHREGQNQQQTEQKKEQTQQQSQQPEQKKVQSTNTPSNSNTSSKKDYQMEEYTKGDKDFDEKNYKDANRLGNTNFFSYKRNDGKYVILEEDMKWVVDEKPSSKMIKNLEAMDTYLEKADKNNNKWTTDDWVRLAGEAINDKRDFTNADPGKNKTTKAYQDRTREWRTNNQIASAHQGATKKKKGVLYTRKSNGEYTGKRKVVKHYDLEEGLFLKHFGNKNSGRYPRGSGDRPYQHDGRHMRRNSTFRSRRSMTDDELMAAINRARKEVDLYRAERDNRSQGQRFVEEVLTSVGKAVIIGAATGGIKYAGKKFVESALGDQDLANAMFGGGGGGKKKNKHKN